MEIDSACPFCEIVAGRAPASVVYADDVIIAFTTIRQTRAGECLVIPKAHIDHFTDIPDALAAHIMVVAQKLGRRMREAFDPLRVGMVVHGFGVAHAHLIVVPQHDPSDIVSGQHAFLDDGVIRFDGNLIPPTQRDELDAIAARLAIA
ncbi:HIT family protein [Uliginosibacterium sp. H1]|uniref:HIT family protein n=1 Tax=Uliginosibacterium sp. H1 TaxID=3114757 RepID=UPI002E19CF12|nr:HIT family protein [Uliginosibacterium sp. H1]